MKNDKVLLFFVPHCGKVQNAKCLKVKIILQKKDYVKTDDTNKVFNFKVTFM